MTQKHPLLVYLFDDAGATQVCLECITDMTELRCACRIDYLELITLPTPHRPLVFRIYRRLYLLAIVTVNNALNTILTCSSSCFC